MNGMRVDEWRSGEKWGDKGEIAEQLHFAFGVMFRIYEPTSDRSVLKGKFQEYLFNARS